MPPLLATQLKQSVCLSPEREVISEKLLALFPHGCKRVLFAVPPETPQEEFVFEVALSRRYPCFPPYGAGLLAAKLKPMGYQTDIVDLNFEFLSHAHAAGTLDRFNSNIWQEKLREKIEEFKPDVVCVSCMFTMTHKFMMRVAEFTKELNPKIPVFAGGVHVSNATELILKDCSSIDFAIKYEADISFPSVLEFVNYRVESSAIEQIATLYDGQYTELGDRISPKINDLHTAPDYHNLDIGKYASLGQIGSYSFMYPGKKVATVLSNRGCRAKCTFCSVRTFNGMGVRGRDATSVADEIEALSIDHGVKHIMWLDDDLLYDGKRAVALFNEITKRNLNITWDASNGVICAAITDEIMEAAVKSGCIGMNLGIESGDPDILRAVKKPGTVDSYRKAAKILNKYPEVFVKGFLIIGFPNETIAQIMRTINLSVELELGWYPIAILTPLPSTEIYKTMTEQGLIEDNLSASNNVNSIVTRGKLRVREEQEKMNAQEFLNFFITSSPDHVPSKEELKDIWFLADYKVNYEKLLTLTSTAKLSNIGKMLKDICDRMTVENALGNLFLGVVEKKLGNHAEASRRALLSEKYVKDSAYWKKRFEALDLYAILNALK